MIKSIKKNMFLVDFRVTRKDSYAGKNVFLIFSDKEKSPETIPNIYVLKL